MYQDNTTKQILNSNMNFKFRWCVHSLVFKLLYERQLSLRDSAFQGDPCLLGGHTPNITNWILGN